MFKMSELIGASQASVVLVGVNTRFTCGASPEDYFLRLCISTLAALVSTTGFIRIPNQGYSTSVSLPQGR